MDSRTDSSLLRRYWYERIMLNFGVDTARLQRRLPEPWRVAERLGGSNLTVGFCEVHLDVDGAGTQRVPARYLYVPINGVVDGDERVGPVNMRYLTITDATAAFHDCAVLEAAAEHMRTSSHGRRGVEVTERYRFVASDCVLEVELTYASGELTRYEGEMHVRCPSNPTLRELYRNEELRCVLRGASAERDLIRSLRYRIEGSVLSDLFDGSERLVSLIAVPASTRAVYSD